MSTSVGINFDFKSIKNDLDAKYFRKFNFQFMQSVQQNTNPYLPFLTGQLMHTAYVEKNDDLNKTSQIVYPVPYAEKQYTTEPLHRTTQTHPWARSRWIEVLTPDDYEHIFKAVIENMGNEFKEAAEKKAKKG